MVLGFISFYMFKKPNIVTGLPLDDIEKIFIVKV